MASPSSPTRFLDRPDGRIGYDVTGTGPLVVCVPGMGELRSSYRYSVPALVSAGFRVAAMDLRGHGDSDPMFSSYDDVAAGGDALALIERLGGPAAIVGNSMGAGAAVWAAAERPELVTAVVLIGPFVRNVRVSKVAAAFLRLAMSGPWAAWMWASYLPTLYPGRKPADFRDHQRAILRSLRRRGYAKAFKATTRTSHAPAAARLGEVKQPALVVMGERDRDFPDPAAEARWIAQQLDTETLLVPGAGHYPQAEYPEVVNPVMVEFLERSGKGSG